MKHKLLIFLVLLNVWVGQTFAQKDNLTEDQQKEVNETVSKINKACTLPAIPAVPDGNTASRDELLDAQKAIQTFVGEGDAYLGCLDKLKESFGDDITTIESSVITVQYNQVVERLQTIAGEFNDQVKVFKARSAD